MVKPAVPLSQVRSPMNVSLTPELERLVEEKVRSGQYASASEVVRAALRLLDRHDREYEARLESLRGKIDAARAELDRGEGIDGEVAMERLLAKRRKVAG